VYTSHDITLLMGNKSSDKYDAVKAQIQAIEDELKRLERWQDAPLPKEKFVDMGPFGMNTMAIEQWIQFVLVPRVHEIVEEKGEFPKSDFSVVAVRAFDGDDAAAKLLELIIAFDVIVNGE